MLCCKLNNKDTLTMMFLCRHLLDDSMLTEEFASFLKIDIGILNVLGLKLKIHFNTAGDTDATCQDTAHETHRS